MSSCQTECLFIFLEGFCWCFFVFCFFFKKETLRYCYDLRYCDSSLNKAPRLVGEGQTVPSTSHVLTLAVFAAPVPKLGSGTGVTGYSVLQLLHHPTAALAEGSSGLQLPPCEVSAAPPGLVPMGSFFKKGHPEGRLASTCIQTSPENQIMHP